MNDIVARLSAALSDRYRIERALGAGGMATVYLAHDVRHDRNVAIKVLKPELAAVLGAERFLVEIKTTASLQHPHILPLFDSGTADGFLFYVMPYIEGETIREKLTRERQLSIDEAVRIAREVADALDYAHRHGVIHRDIKPENVLLHDGRSMVMDFGIALAVSAAAGGRMTETGLSLGTPHYMSPEQATAEKELTPRSDIYSLGSVLYEMLAGEPPHVGGSAQAVIMKIITDVARPVNQLRRSVPPHVVAAVAKSIERLPADRFESAKAFSDALANPGFTTPGIMVGAPGARGPGISPRLFWVTAVLGLVSLFAAVWGWRRPEPVRAVTKLSMTLPDSQHLGDFAGTFRIAVSPDGRAIAYVGQGTTASSTRLWIRQLDQLRATPLAGTDGATNPAFSPDGKRIAYVTSPPRSVRVVSALGGPPSVLTDSLVDSGGLTWGSDGYIYYDGHLTGDGVARIRESGGKPEAASMPDSASGELYHNNPSALPNGRGVVITIIRGVGSLLSFDVGVLDTRTGKHTMLTHGAVGRYAASGHLVYVTNDGVMMAAPFDAEDLRITGDAVPVADGVLLRPGGRAEVAISGTGLMVYAGGTVSEDKQELVWVDRDGKATQVDPSFVRPFAGRVRLSPDGRKAAVSQTESSSRRSAWVKELDRGPAAKILDGNGPAWSPDGKLLLTSTPTRFLLAPSDGSRLATPIAAGINNAKSKVWELTADVSLLGFPEWSTDGKWVTYSGTGNIYAMGTGPDSTKVQLVTGVGLTPAPSLSPDGRWLAYSSDESGRAEVFVRPFPDTKSSKRQVSGEGGILPRWSRNGRELFFVDASSHMIAIPVTPGPAFTTGIPRRLFDVTSYNVVTRPFDVAPDGRFLMLRPFGPAAMHPDELILVENAFEEFKAKVKPQ